MPRSLLLIRLLYGVGLKVIIFTGKNKRDHQKQTGNTVPVKFAERVAENIRKILVSQDENSSFEPEGEFQLKMAL